MTTLLHRHALLSVLLGVSISGVALASPAIHAEHDAKITAHFQQADSNKDGKLSLDEFKAMKHQHHAEHAERRDERREDRRERMVENMQEKFSKADTNRDGLISKAEAQREMPRVFAKFDALDSNKDGQLSKVEITAGHAGHR